MSDLLPLAALPVGMVVGFLAITFLLRKPKPSLYAGRDMAKPNATIPMYCRDCGKSLISYRSMDGYDIKSGQPSYSFQRACSDANKSGSPTVSNSWPYCGNRARQNDVAGGHTHTDLEAVTTDCPACVDQMLRDKVVTYEQALALYGKMTFKAEMGDSTRDDLMALARQYGGYGPNGTPFPFLGSSPSKP